MPSVRSAVPSMAHQLSACLEIAPKAQRELQLSDLDAWVGAKPTKKVKLESLAVTFAKTTGNQIETLIDGAQVYPRILEDLRAAQSSIRIIQFGFKDCKIGREVAAILMEKACSGIDVELTVSALGSQTMLGSKALYDEMAEMGVKIVTNDGIVPIKKRGMWGESNQLTLHKEELHCFEHRKIIVVDDNTAYTGGMGFEDHFVDKMHDVMVRVEGPAAKQLKALCEQSFDFYRGKPLVRPRAKPRLAMPASADESGQVTVLQNVPGIRWRKINEALFRAIDNAKEELWVMNPYIGDQDITDKLCAASKRGVKVRVIFAGNPENPFAKGKQRAQYRDLLKAGVEIYQYPTLLHAKVLVADDKEVIVGSMNLDNLSTTRNFETVLRLEDPAIIKFYKEELFAKDLLKCTRKESLGNNVVAHAFYALCGRVDRAFHD